MPLTAAAPSNKRKANKIITDLSNVSQNGTKHTHNHATNHTNHILTHYLQSLCELYIQPSKCQTHLRACVQMVSCSLIQPLSMNTQTHVHTSRNTISSMHVTSPAGIGVIIRWQRSHKSVTIKGNTEYQTVIQLQQQCFLALFGAVAKKQKCI